MIAVVFFFVTIGLAMLAALSLRWLQVMERIEIERAKAGGKELTKTVEDLQLRVNEIEKYMTGEDYKFIERGK
jgi:hypothetical protein